MKTFFFYFFSYPLNLFLKSNYINSNGHLSFSLLNFLNLNFILITFKFINIITLKIKSNKLEHILYILQIYN